jgi:hypothetical protein
LNVYAVDELRQLGRKLDDRLPEAGCDLAEALRA